MRQIIRLTESDLHNIIKNSVNKILREHEGWNEEDWNPCYPKDEKDDDGYDTIFDKWKRQREDEWMRGGQD